MNEPRPDGWDYDKPDPENLRCQKCNKNGFNRTGLLPIHYVGASTTGVVGIDCPAKCKNGLKSK